MDYKNKLEKASVIKTNGTLVLPVNYTGETNFVIPDQIVTACIERYGLTKENIKILDPMCGIGTIPRVINSAGGNCMGIELDENRYTWASQGSDQNKIILGNLLTHPLEKNNFDCIFTSLPFDWFKKPNSNVNSEYGKKMQELLKENGFLLIDSLPFVNRQEFHWPVASRQCEYLEQQGFSLIEIVKFSSLAEPSEDYASIIMKFSVL